MCDMRLKYLNVCIISMCNFNVLAIINDYFHVIDTNGIERKQNWVLLTLFHLNIEDTHMRS